MNIDCTPQMIVNFEIATGNIYSVGPSKAEGYDNIEVDFSSVERILNFKDNKADYRVVFNTIDSKFELKHEAEILQTYQGYTKIESGIDDADIEITYDGAELKININDRIKKILDTTSLDSETSFSITAKDNPHILYHLFRVDLRKDNSCLFDSSKNFSIYTKRQFAKYNYKDLT